ncbi:MAG: hypothetical protein ACYTGG_12610, partial [Planctomycetota bacterium]
MNPPSPLPSSDRPSDPEAATANGRFTLDFVHRVHFTDGVLEPTNNLLRQVLTCDQTTPIRSLAFIDSGVAEHWPHLQTQIDEWIAVQGGAVELAARPRVVPGGEQAKNDRSILDEILRAIHDARICRQSCVLA